MKDSYSGYSSEWVNKRKSSKHYAHDFLEKPAMFDLVGKADDKSILCLGCGSGEECFYLADQGASYVKGIDISKGLIEAGKYSRPDLGNVDLESGDISRMGFGNNDYDLVFSSLTFHYIENWQEMLVNIKNSLKPSGRLIFSTHHPIKWGGQSIRNSEYNKFILGYEKNKRNGDYKVWGDYLSFRKISDRLFGKMDVEYYNRSISRVFDELREVGFIVDRIVEPMPQKTSSIPEDFVNVYSKIPLFLIISAKTMS